MTRAPEAGAVRSIVWRRGQEGFPAGHEPRAVRTRPGSTDRSACLWSAGFIANRADLLAETGLAPDAGDDELLLDLFLRRDVAAVERLAGTLSFVLWDDASGRLIAARDRLGTSGLYYAEIGDEVVVSDRIAPVRDRLPAPSALNLRTLTAHLHGRAPLADETCFEAIRALPPGAVLVATRGGLEVRTYWRVEPRPRLRLRGAAAYGAALRELLYSIGREYWPRSPCAITLSGGLDSTSVAAALRNAAPGARIAAFTFAAPELPAADESRYAGLAARRLGLEPEVLRFDLRWPLSGAEGLRTSMETPLVSYAEIWAELYARLRQRGLRVLFTGVSGDHLFGGTGVLVYPDLLLGGRWRELARQLGEHRRRSPEGGLLGLLDGDLLRPLVRAFLPRRVAAARSRLPWLGATAGRLHRETLAEGPARWRMLPGRRLRLEALGDRMVAHGAAQAARAAAEHGIELRHPLIDHRLMEFAASLPVERCRRAGVAKVILRDAMRGVLPDEVLDLDPRIYPMAVFHRGVRERERDKVWALITGMRAAELGLVVESEVQDAYRRYLEGELGSALWHTLCVEDWLRRYA